MQANYNRLTKKQNGENIELSQTEDKLEEQEVRKLRAEASEEHRTTTTEEETRALQEKEVVLDCRQGAQHPQKKIVKTINKNEKKQGFQKLVASPDKENPT